MEQETSMDSVIGDGSQVSFMTSQGRPLDQDQWRGKKLDRNPIRNEIAIRYYLSRL